MQEERLDNTQLLEWAKQAYATENYEGAWKTAYEVTKADRWNLEASLLVCKSLIKLGNLEYARVALGNLRDIDPENLEVRELERILDDGSMPEAIRRRREG